MTGSNKLTGVVSGGQTLSTFEPLRIDPSVATGAEDPAGDAGQEAPLAPSGSLAAVADPNTLLRHALAPGSGQQLDSAQRTKMIRQAKVRYVEWARGRIETAAGRGQTDHRKSYLSLGEQASLPGSADDPSSLLGRVSDYRKSLGRGRSVDVEALLQWLEQRIASEPDDPARLPADIRGFYEDAVLRERAENEYLTWATQQIRLAAGNATLSSRESRRLPADLARLASELQKAARDAQGQVPSSIATADLIRAIRTELSQSRASGLAALPDNVVGLLERTAAVEQAKDLFEVRLTQSWLPALEAAAAASGRAQYLSKTERRQLPPQLDRLVGLVTDAGIDLGDLEQQLRGRQQGVDARNLATLSPELALLLLEVRGFEPVPADQESTAAAIREAKDRYLRSVAAALAKQARGATRLSAAQAESLPLPLAALVAHLRDQNGAPLGGPVSVQNVLGWLEAELAAVDDADASQLPLFLVPFFAEVAPDPVLPKYEPPPEVPADLPEHLQWLQQQLATGVASDGYISKADTSLLHRGVQSLIAGYRQQHPGKRVRVEPLIESLVELSESPRTARKIKAQIDSARAAEQAANGELKPYLEWLATELAAASGGNDELSYQEQRTNLSKTLQDMAQIYRDDPSSPRSVKVGDLIRYLVDNSERLDLVDKLRPLIAAEDVPPVSIEEVLAVGSGEYEPLIRALLTAADANGDGVTVKELDAYLKNPDPLDLRFLSSSTLATLFPGLLEMQTPARLTTKGALDLDMNIRRKIAELPLAWQRTLASKADGQGPKGVDNEYVTLHELKAVLSDVRDGILTMEKDGLRLEGKGKTGKGWKTNAQWPKGRIWWLPEQLLDMVRLRIAVAGRQQHPLIPRQTGAGERPAGAQSTLAHGYMYVCHNNRQRVPAYVAFTMRAADIHLRPFVPREDAFRADPYLPRDASSYPADYYKHHRDIGHMKFAASSADLQAMFESFLHSNMSPQPGKNNRTTWQDGELSAKELAKSGAYDLTYFVGNAFLKTVDGELVPMTDQEIQEQAAWIGRTPSGTGMQPSKSGAPTPRVAEPTHLWLVRYVQAVGNPGDVHAEAWLIPNIDAAVPPQTGLPGLAQGDDEEVRILRHARVSVDEIEELFDLDFMPHLPNTVEAKAEADRSTLLAPPREVVKRYIDQMRSGGGLPPDLFQALGGSMDVEALAAAVEADPPRIPPAFDVWLWQQLGYKNIPLVYGFLDPAEALEQGGETVNLY